MGYHDEVGYAIIICNTAITVNNNGRGNYDVTEDDNDVLKGDKNQTPLSSLSLTSFIKCLAFVSRKRVHYLLPSLFPPARYLAGDGLR